MLSTISLLPKLTSSCINVVHMTLIAKLVSKHFSLNHISRSYSISNHINTFANSIFLQEENIKDLKECHKCY